MPSSGLFASNASGDPALFFRLLRGVEEDRAIGAEETILPVFLVYHFVWAVSCDLPPSLTLHGTHSCPLQPRVGKGMWGTDSRSFLAVGISQRFLDLP
eukprot:3636324-Rhodomonas_salina.3